MRRTDGWTLLLFFTVGLHSSIAGRTKAYSSEQHFFSLLKKKWHEGSTLAMKKSHVSGSSIYKWPHLWIFELWDFARPIISLQLCANILVACARWWQRTSQFGNFEHVFGKESSVCIQDNDCYSRSKYTIKLIMLSNKQNALTFALKVHKINAHTSRQMPWMD